MKKKFLLGVLAICCLLSTASFSYAQEEDYLEEGKKWTMQSLVSGMMFDGGYVNYYTFSILDEVEKFGYVWKRSSTAGSDFLLYRQEGKKIWAVNQYSKMHIVPFLMFDFGLGKGDTAHLYVDTVWHIDDAWIVEDVFDSVFEPGQAARRCQSVYLMKYPDRKDLWVEGIGSLTNGLTYMPDNTVGGFAELICLQTSAKEVLYRNSNYKECEYPNHFSYDYSIQNWSVLCTEEHLHTESMYFKGNGPKQWRQAYCATKEDFSDEKPLGLYYQDMLQVYFKENENAPAVLLFDFGLEQGESALVSDKVLWTVDSVYYLEIDGLKRRCQQMSSEIGETDVWIEGLGSLKTGFFPTEFFIGTTELLCVQADVFWHRDYMYHNKKYHSCYIDEPASKTYTGTLVSIPNPAMEIPTMPGLVMGLECGDNQYILSKKGWFWDDYVEVGGIRYEMGDSVEIEGVVSTHIDLLNRTYFELEIETIRKIVSAQEIAPNVVQEGRLWSLYRGMSMGEMLRFTGENPVMFFGADTLINGKTYKNVLYRKVFYWDNFDELPNYDWGCAMREEGSKVYQYDYKLGKERLMFDFSLKPGDTVETYSKFVVTEVGVLEVDNPLYYIDLRDIERDCGDRWIERIGSETSGIFWNDCWCCAGYWNNLACCKEKDAKDPFFFGKYFSECLSAEYATFTGEIAFVSDPPSSQTYLPNSDTSTLWAVIDNPKEKEYDALKRMTLMRNSTPFAQKLVVDGVEYFAGDKVEIMGWRSSDMKSGGGTDSYLEIHFIKKKDNVGVETSDKAELRITPNPAKETIALRATGCNLQKVEILDVNGRVLHAAALNGTASFDYNVSQMPSGIYLARVKTSCGVLTEKFSVK